MEQRPESIERDRQETQLAILETASESLYTSRTVLSLGDTSYHKQRQHIRSEGMYKRGYGKNS